MLDLTGSLRGNLSSKVSVFNYLADANQAKAVIARIEALYSSVKVTALQGRDEPLHNENSGGADQ